MLTRTAATPTRSSSRTTPKRQQQGGTTPKGKKSRNTNSDISDSSTAAQDESLCELIDTLVDRQAEGLLGSQQDTDQGKFQKFSEYFKARAREAIQTHRQRVDKQKTDLELVIKSLREEEAEWKDMLEEARQEATASPAPSETDANLIESVDVAEDIQDLVDSVLQDCVQSSHRLQLVADRISDEVSTIRESTQQMHSFFGGVAEQLSSITQFAGQSSSASSAAPTLAAAASSSATTTTTATSSQSSESATNPKNLIKQLTASLLPHLQTTTATSSSSSSRQQQ